MERDIDDLLDEVETKFVNTPRKSGVVASHSRDKQTSSAKSKPKTPVELSKAFDAAIDDILDIDISDEKQVNSDAAKEQRLRPLVSDQICKSDQGKRCCPVFLGGSDNSMGMSSAVSYKACDRLRCTSCDFQVCSFDNLSWNKDTDYLFLRNNVPNFTKLKTQLSKSKGCRAYCCQCSWRNVQELCQLTDPALKWVCGKHTS